MRRTRVWITLVCCLFAVAVLAWAQTRSAGLWEITNTMTWQKAPLPADSDEGPTHGGVHHEQVCLTQEMIDKYGALMPHSNRECHLENKVLLPGSMTADYVCNGRMKGKGALESTWTDAQHAKGKVHFVGTLLIGAEAKPVEWTTESVSVFKSANCGIVKPKPLPPELTPVPAK